MKRFFFSLRRRWPHLCLLLMLLLLASCTPEGCANPEVAQKIKDYTGLDISNPVEVTKAALTGETVGNEAQAEALDAGWREQRLKHLEKTGAGFERDGRYGAAADRYSGAARYVRTDSPAGLEQAQGLYEDKARASMLAAGKSLSIARAEAEEGEMRELYYKVAGRDFERGADALENARDMAALRGDITKANELSARAEEYRERAEQIRRESIEFKQATAAEPE
ncbi:hypothetical protein ACFLTY_02740 [Chloroflexota bacterium]